MRCQDLERLILESTERELNQEERLSLEKHLSQCKSCAAFREFFEDLRHSLQKSPAPGLPSDLEEKVRFACHTELLARTGGQTKPAASRPSASIPWLVWAALAALTVMTALFLIPAVQELWQNQQLSLKATFALILLLQNIVALLIVPVLIRGQRDSWRFLTHENAR
jgi:anti-sigma factor RsiW